MRFAVLAIVGLAAFASSPVNAQAAMAEYEKCPQKPFVKMVECGTRGRQANCGGLFTPACSASGDQVVAFANSLAKSVGARQLSESAAERQWIQFKMVYYKKLENNGASAEVERLRNERFHSEIKANIDRNTRISECLAQNNSKMICY